MTCLQMGDRKARLAALAAKAGRTKKPREAPTNDDEGDPQESIEEKRTQSVAFRNYAPNDKSLAGEGNDEEESPSKKQRVEDDKPTTAASALQNALLEAKQEIAASATAPGKGPTADESTAAPKKINWDLKRDIQDKLNKLEKRTQKAIVEMLRERLEKEATEQANDDDSDLD